MKVEKEKFDKVLGNLLHQKPLKRADAKPAPKPKPEKPKVSEKSKSGQQ